MRLSCLQRAQKAPAEPLDSMHNPPHFSTVSSTLLAADGRPVSRKHLRRQERRRRARAALAPVAGTLVAGLLVVGATIAHPAVANAETPNGSHVVQTASAVSTDVSSDTSADALFERTHERADARAAEAVAAANAALASVKGKVDTATLSASIASLANYPYLDTTTVQSLTNTAVSVTTQAVTAAAAVDKAAAEAAAAAAAQAAAEAQAAADAQALANTPDGARTVAAQMASDQYGWGSDQFQCLNSLWSKESGWNYQAENASSGAYGIPQALPGSKMSTIADDWATNAVTQISWGLDYISRGYGTPCSAWSHSQSVNWY